MMYQSLNYVSKLKHKGNNFNDWRNSTDSKERN